MFSSIVVVMMLFTMCMIIPLLLVGFWFWLRFANHCESFILQLSNFISLEVSYLSVFFMFWIFFLRLLSFRLVFSLLLILWLVLSFGVFGNVLITSFTELAIRISVSVVSGPVLASLPSILWTFIFFLLSSLSCGLNYLWWRNLNFRMLYWLCWLNNWSIHYSDRLYNFCYNRLFYFYRRLWK